MTKFRKQLAKDFEKYNVEHENALQAKLEARDTSGFYKLHGQSAYSFLSYLDTPFKTQQKDLAKLDEMENKIEVAYQFEDKLGRKIKMYAPQRLQERVLENYNEELKRKKEELENEKN